MSVVFDLLGAQNRDHGDRGIARYVASIALALEEVAPGFVDTYLVRPELPIPGRLAPLIGTGRVRRLESGRTWPLAGGGVFLSGSVFELQHPHSATIPLPYRSPAWSRAAVLYDLIPLRYPDHYLGHPLARTVFHARAELLRSMDDIFAISQATADDAAELLAVPPGRLTVIHAGADEQFRPNPGGHEVAVAEVHADPPVPGLRARYLLSPSGIEWRKNNERLMEAFAALPHELRERHQLVIVCKVTDEERAALAALSDQLGITPDVLVTGYVSDEALVRLYQAAHLVVFPSRYEGFGLPVLEALRCGAPVVCSDSSSLREVQTDPDMRFDPEDTAAITATLEKYLVDADARAAAFAVPVPDYSWQQGARLIVDALGRRAAERSRVRPSRPRVALVSPLPPQRSGIAMYASHFVARLAAAADVTVFVDGDPSEVDPVEGVEIHAAGHFDGIDAARPFDRIVTFLGNSHFHVDALDIVLRHGGLVVLHDVRLTGLYAEVQKQHPERLAGGTVGAALAALYPGRYSAGLEAMTVIDPGTAADKGVQLLAGVIEAADDVLVHSNYAAAVAELDTGHRPEVLFGLPYNPPVPAALRVPVPNHLVTLGVLSPAKLPEVLLDALVVLRRDRAVTLTFCGDGPEDYVAYLRDAAAGRGLAEAVEVTGFLDDAGYAREIGRASIAVQLRAFTNGESSAAVQDAVANGIPTVASRLGAMGEYPLEVVVPVEPGIDAAGLAAVLGDLLDDTDRREAMSVAALDHAARHSYAAAADALVTRLALT